MTTPAEIIAQYDHLLFHHANEAATRLKVINDVLYSVLGWTHNDIAPEERVSEDGSITWADYVIRTGMTAAVVEAKKVGVCFDNVPNTRRAQLNGKLVKDALGDAIIQARDYARKLSIPFAIVTNGDTWIIFPATRTDQVKFQDSSAIIFPSLRSALQDDYAEFYDLLSRASVISGRLEHELLGRVENQIEARRLNSYFKVGFSRVSRHSLFPLIEDAVTSAFTEDIVNADPDLLEKCYVNTPDRLRFDSRIKMHAARKESATAKAPHRPLRDKNPQVGSIISDAASRARPLAILVLGQVGAGKTTFLEYTHKIETAETFQQRADQSYAYWMQIDFRTFSKEESAHDYILQALKKLISADPFLSDYNRCIKHAYASEIEELFKGPLFLISGDEKEKNARISALIMSDYEKTQPYVEKLISYAAQNVPVFLVIDNIDQFEDEGVQSSIFADAMALARKLSVSLICAMRETTFVRHRNTPIFDAFDFDPVTIDPPQVLSVLSKRFFVARHLLQDKSGRFTAENGADVQVADLRVVIDLVQGSVLGSEIGTLIDVLATGDIRLALRMTREFLQSGWTASGKALRIYQQTGKYVMPRHEALRAIMLGNNTVYSEATSVLGNPFDSRLAKTEAQLLRLFVLAAAVQYSSESNFRYLEGLEIQRAVREVGFGDSATTRVLADLCSLRFMHTVSHSMPTFESNYIVSRLGGYIVRHFMSNMMFVENVMMDTFIPRESTWNELYGLTNQIYSSRDTIGRLKVRKKRVQFFMEVMREQYAPLRSESIRRGLPKEWCTDPFAAAANQLSINLEKAMHSAERNYGADAK